MPSINHVDPNASYCWKCNFYTEGTPITVCPVDGERLIPLATPAYIQAGIDAELGRH